MTPTEIARRTQNRVEDALVRAVVATVRQRVVPDGAEKYLARRPEDEVSRQVYRAVQSLGTVDASGWAAELAQQAPLAFVIGLGPLSAAARLFDMSVQVPISQGQAAAPVSGVVSAAGAAAFVAPGDPIPVTKFEFDTATLEPRKLAVLTAITRELAKGARAEGEIRRLLRESAALTLDAVLFGEADSTDAAPAGLFYGLDPIAAGAFDGDPMVNDLASLAAAVTPIGGDRIAYLASPARAVQISARVPQLRYPVLASAAIADTRVAAVAYDALALTVGPSPDIVISQEGVVHMSTAPAEIVSEGPATADPVRSMYQTATVGIRLLLDIDWQLRADGAVAVREEVAW